MMSTVQSQAMFWSMAILCIYLGFLVAKAKQGRQEEDLAEIHRILDGFRLEEDPSLSIRNRWQRLKALTAPRDPKQAFGPGYQDSYVGRHRASRWSLRKPAKLDLDPGPAPAVVEVFE